MSRSSDRFPRLNARTQRFTLGRPRTVTVAPDGERVAFLRSTGGEDPVNRLWVWDVASGDERLVADPTVLLDDVTDVDLPLEERRRRERAREGSGGIVAYGTDDDVAVAAFVLGGRLFIADLVSGEVAELPTTGPAIDPHPSPDGRQVAYVSGGSLHVTSSQGSVELVSDPDPDVTWGEAEFIAAEEMGRSRGFWWGPDGERLAVARVDVDVVPRWHIANPVDPAEAPQEMAYPSAGAPNADVTLWVVGLDGEARRVDWDRDDLPYLARVRWGRGPLTLLVQRRDQRRTEVLTADPDTGATTPVLVAEDERWVELLDGAPTWLPDGRLVTTVDRDDTRQLAIDGQPVSPAGLQVRRILGVGASQVHVAASEDDPTEVHVWAVPVDGEAPRRLSDGAGVHHASIPNGDGASDVLVLGSSRPDRIGPEVQVIRDGTVVGTITSHGADPGFTPSVRPLELGERGLRGALLLPTDDPGGPLPVLLDPYGGPHAQRVVAAADAYLTSQWFADQGFAVLIVDGRGTPGRGPAWERAVHLDLATAALDDQVDGLMAAADTEPRLDLDRVAIRGWSFGGYLAALAVLRRPDAVHAAIAGAPVTDWRLYDTHYTERYLGLPADQPDVYARSSLLDDAARLERPLLLIHGLADDNVVAAHSLALSRALLEAGRAHTFLPLSGVTHMTPQEVVAENLLHLQLDFLRGALAHP